MEKGVREKKEIKEGIGEISQRKERRLKKIGKKGGRKISERVGKKLGK